MNGAVGADGSIPDEVALRLLLPNNMVGSIIGKGGVTIKEITQQSNARIHINHNDDAGTVERLVAVLGTYDEVVNAHRMIAVRVQEEGPNREKGRDAEGTRKGRGRDAGRDAGWPRSREKRKGRGLA